MYIADRKRFGIVGVPATINIGKAREIQTSLPGHVQGHILKLMAVTVVSASLSAGYQVHAEQSKAKAAAPVTQPATRLMKTPKLPGSPSHC
jgi:hypothetical protein